MEKNFLKNKFSSILSKLKELSEKPEETEDEEIFYSAEEIFAESEKQEAPITVGKAPGFEDQLSIDFAEPKAVPEVKAEVPEVKAEVPEVKAEVPEVKAEVPEVKAEVPEVKAEVPEVKVEVPEVKAEVPEVKAEVPEVKAEAPDAAVAEIAPAEPNEKIELLGEDDPEFASLFVPEILNEKETPEEVPTAETEEKAETETEAKAEPNTQSEPIPEKEEAEQPTEAKKEESEKPAESITLEPADESEEESEDTDDDADDAELTADDGDAEGNDRDSCEKVLGYDEKIGKYLVAHYRRGFESRLIQANPGIKKFYSELKNELLSYVGVKSRISWTSDNFHCGRNQIAKINAKTGVLVLYFATDPKKLEGTVYRGRDVGDKKKYVETPFEYKVRTPRKFNWALELIRKTCEEHGLSRVDAQKIDYTKQYPYETTEELVNRGLIKEYITEELPADVSLELIKKAGLEEIQTGKTELRNKTEATVQSVQTEQTEQIPDDIAAEEEQPAEKEIETVLPEPETEAAEPEAEEPEVEEPEVEESEVEEPEEPEERYQRPTEIVVGNIDLREIEDYYEDGETVNLASLKEKDLIPEEVNSLKIFASGRIQKRLTVEAEQFTINAVKAISYADGEATMLQWN